MNFTEKLRDYAQTVLLNDTMGVLSDPFYLDEDLLEIALTLWKPYTPG